VIGTKKKVIIYGAGGHGAVLADVLRALEMAGEPYHHIGYCDDNTTLVKSKQTAVLTYCLEVDLPVVEHDCIVIAIGDNRIRKRKYDEMFALGERITTIIHPRSILGENVSIGNGAQVIAGAVINTGAIIGDDTIINTGCIIDHHTEIGDHVHIAPGSNLGGCVRVGEGALIGIGATVMPGISLGAWSTVGAGAVVNRNVGAGKTVVGVPAKILQSNR
jgi:sugar O-acyltransferase (sialic acid O-acetyltransferase NeuD family)